jgi:hypothetical protein
MQIWPTIYIKPNVRPTDCRETFLEPGQKGLSYEAREESASGGIFWQYVDTSASSATKSMGLFQQAP